MQVRMKMQVLAPGVKHREKTDGCSQMLGIGCNGEQRFGSSAEQEAVNLFGILKSQMSQFLRERKRRLRNARLCSLESTVPADARASLDRKPDGGRAIRADW